jgi:hypothetical protein
MQSIYRSPRIFAERFLHGMDEEHRTPVHVMAGVHAERVVGRASAATAE